MKKKEKIENCKKSLRIFRLAIVSIFVFIISGAIADERRGEKNNAGEVAEPEKMTGAQMLAWISQQKNMSGAVLESVQRMLESARLEKDTIKMTCLDDKVTQIQISYKGAEERKETLTVSINKNDMVSAKQIISILKIYFSRIIGLSSEAENCLGESDVVLGKTESTTYISADITPEDPSDDISEDFGVDQPAQISAYM